MLQSMRIKAFRCFEDLELSPLARVNLLAGRNNTGKTAALEALFLHFGPHNPELPVRLSVQRGIERLKVDPDELWGWLFTAKQLERTIELSSLGTDGTTRSVTLRLALPGSHSVASRPISVGGPDVGAGSLTTANVPAELVIESRIGSSPPTVSRASIEGGELKYYPSATVSPVNAVFLSTRSRHPAEDAERFSRLDALGRQEEVVAPLAALEPRLRRLAVLVRGGLPMIHGDVGSSELLPLPMMGEGMVRLLSILLAIAFARDAVVLVDEVENGLHYSVHRKVWQAIDKATKDARVQFFATTHSLECIRAAHEAFGAAEANDFRLFRIGEGRHRLEAFAFDRDALGAALATDLEVR